MRFEMKNPKQSAAGLAKAVTTLEAGGLVAFPTETVYGLGADATNPAAVAGIFAAKGRPSFNPLIVHCVSLAEAERLARFDPLARKLAKAFWPGPLTLVLPKAVGCKVAELAMAGLDTLAIRVPAHPIAAELLAAFGRPLAAPSANRSGRVSPTSAEHVEADLGAMVDVILDGGAAAVGLESTIIAVMEGRVSLLRPGGITRQAIEAVLGRALDKAEIDQDRPPAPGMLRSHYAPQARVRLDAREIRAGEALLDFGPAPPRNADQAVAVVNLSQAGNLTEAAAALFGALRELDAPGRTIAVAPIPNQGLGEAINDRLMRAAAPRDPD